MKIKHQLAISSLTIILFACKTVGPQHLVQDRSAYINAISDSRKNQLLLNIVKLRYADAPEFLDINSIVNSYEVRKEMNAKLGFESKGYGWMPGVGGSTSFSDKPTVSYAPLSGNKFAMSLMNPLGPSTVLGLVFAGYPVDMIFRLTVSSINGIKNSYSGSLRKTEVSVEFNQLLEALKRIQENNGLIVNMHPGKEGMIDLNFNTNKEVDVSKDIQLAKTLLGIKGNKEILRVSYGSLVNDSVEIALKTRSLLEVITDIASAVEVPAEHIVSKQALPMENNFPFLRIHSSNTIPKDPFFAINYNGFWFYLDKTDYESKKKFSFLLLLSSLSDLDDHQGSPVLTIPVN